MCIFQVNSLQEVITTPCCIYYNTGITHAHLGLLDRAAKIARAKYGWYVQVTKDELNEAQWRVYLGNAKIHDPEIELVKLKTGPVDTFREIVDELAKTVR